MGVNLAYSVGVSGTHLIESGSEVNALNFELVNAAIFGVVKMLIVKLLFSAYFVWQNKAIIKD